MTLTPLSPIYAWVMGGVDEAKERRPTQAELEQMAVLLHEAMDLGAVGFSYQRCGPVSTQPDWDGSPMITDLLTDEEILFFGRELAKRGEGFIEMFDKYPTAHDTLEDFMDALGEASGRPIVRNILMGDLAPTRSSIAASSSGSTPATSAACATTGWRSPSGPPPSSPSTTGACGTARRAGTG